MCGICGLVTIGPCAADYDLQPALEAQQHRGPDAWGAWADTHCALGHRRLSIIDLSEAGRQPMANEDGTLWITFNGEIYNFQELRAELESAGHQFHSGTDTEVIVHAYEQYGPDCVRRFRGMFAFAIWDQRRRRLFIARDRLGKKPLFYCLERGRFLFASELQALLADAAVPREIEPEALDAYLSLGYIPAPLTAFRAIRKLPPAHWLTLDLTDDGLVAHIERYWSLSYLPKLRIGEAEACEALYGKLREAVRLRLVSDVPLGAFLSGGIDSSIIVGLMAQLSAQPVKTFSIGFHQASFCELPHARRVAERWQTEHHELIVQPDALSVLPRLVRHYGEPFADSSAIPTYYVAAMTRESVGVALTGDGGDESFAGYDRYLANRLAERSRWVPGIGPVARAALAALPASIHPRGRLQQARRFLTGLHRPMQDRYRLWVGASAGCFEEAQKQQLYTEEFQDLITGSILSEWWPSLFPSDSSLDALDQAMAADVQSYLPYDLLVKADIASMAASLEVRSPFLDVELMEFAARLPVALKARGRDTKHLLKRACQSIVPEQNLERRKMGFGVPVSDWFRGPLRDLLHDGLAAKETLTGDFFRPAEVRRLITEHTSARTDHSFQLWTLLMLELWLRDRRDTDGSRPAIRRSVSQTTSLENRSRGVDGRSPLRSSRSARRSA